MKVLKVLKKGEMYNKGSRYKLVFDDNSELYYKTKKDAISEMRRDIALFKRKRK